jgi:hypothetical protein
LARYAPFWMDNECFAFSLTSLSNTCACFVSNMLSLQVTEGYDLVERISKVPTRNDNPTQPIKMISIRVA